MSRVLQILGHWLLVTVVLAVVLVGAYMLKSYFWMDVFAHSGWHDVAACLGGEVRAMREDIEAW